MLASRGLREAMTGFQFPLIRKVEQFLALRRALLVCKLTTS
jgi:hypothetical protein